MNKLLLFITFLGMAYVGGITSNEIDQYLGVQMKGGAVAVSFHILYHQFWGGITAMFLYFLVK